LESCSTIGAPASRDRIEHFDLDRLREMRAKTPGDWRNDWRNREQAADEARGGATQEFKFHAAMLLTEALTLVSNNPLRHILRFDRIDYALTKSPAGLVGLRQLVMA
jgi:hypothetical protein